MADKTSNLIHKLYSSAELSALVASRAKARRIALRLRQVDVANASGVAIATVRRFESTGSVHFEAVVAIAMALDVAEGLLLLFPMPPLRSIDEISQRRTPPSRVRKGISW